MTVPSLNKDAIHYNYSICKRLKSISEKLLSSLGLSDVTYIKFVDNNKRFFISTNNQWVKSYIEYELYNNKQHNDIWRNYIFQNNNIRYALWDSLEETDVFRSAYGHDMSNGFMLFNEQELFSFSTKNSTTNNTLVYLNNLDFFEKFAAYFKSEANDIISQANKVNIITSKIARTNDNVANSIIHTPQPLCNDAFKQNKFYLGDKLEGKYLTKSEFKCVFYMAKGKTMKEIAKILNLSARTIESHIANVKYKLNCFSKKQLLDIVNKSDLQYLMETTYEI